MELRAGRWSCSQGRQASGEIGSKVVEVAEVAGWLPAGHGSRLWGGIPCSQIPEATHRTAAAEHLRPGCEHPPAQCGIGIQAIKSAVQLLGAACWT